MNKPVPFQLKPALDYLDCVDYINEKYNINIDNYAGRTTYGDNDDAPRQNFWHELTDRGSIKNDSYFEMSAESVKWYRYGKEYTENNKWLGEIYKMFFDEFGEYKDEEGYINFWVEW